MRAGWLLACQPAKGTHMVNTDICKDYRYYRKNNGGGGRKVRTSASVVLRAINARFDTCAEVNEVWEHIHTRGKITFYTFTYWAVKK